MKSVLPLFVFLVLIFYSKETQAQYCSHFSFVQSAWPNVIAYKCPAADGGGWDSKN